MNKKYIQINEITKILLMDDETKIGYVVENISSILEIDEGSIQTMEFQSVRHTVAKCESDIIVILDKDRLNRTR